MCPLSEAKVALRPVFAQRRSGGMAYASVSKTDSRKGVGVRVPPSAFQQMTIAISRGSPGATSPAAGRRTRRRLLR